MKKKRKMLTLLLITVSIIILLFTICILILSKNKSNIISNILDLSESYEVKTCTEKFYMYCKVYKDSSPNAIFELLDKEYIKYYNLDTNTFKQKLGTIDSDKLSINEVYKMGQKDNISLYLIKAYELYKNSNKSKEFNILLKLDKEKNTFSVYLNDYIIDNNYINLNLGDKVNISLKNIKEKENNTYDSYMEKDINNIENIFYDFKNLCIFYEEYAYKLVDEECKQLKFINYENFDSYITSNFKYIVNMKLIAYEYIQKDGYIEYRCISNEGKVFVFKVTSYITYTVTIE